MQYKISKLQKNINFSQKYLNIIFLKKYFPYLHVRSYTFFESYSHLKKKCSVKPTKMIDLEFLSMVKLIFINEIISIVLELSYKFAQMQI